MSTENLQAQIEREQAAFRREMDQKKANATARHKAAYYVGTTQPLPTPTNSKVGT